MKRGTPDAVTSTRARLAGDLLPRVERIARAIAQRTPSHVDRGDILGAARLGLAEALARIDSRPAASLEAYALMRTRGSIADAFRESDVLTRTERRNVRKLEKAEARLTTVLGRHPTRAELAGSAAMTEAACTEAQVAADRRIFSSADSSDDDVCVSDEESPETLLACRREFEQLAKWRESLSPRLRLVLDLYYDDELTLREIADQLGVSEARASQLRKIAIEELRERTRAA
jgi:RNA polymerase sigma factor FliA